MRIGDYGPFVSALIAVLIPLGLLIALLAGFPVNMDSALTVLVPGMTLAALMLAVSLAWIFILIGRLHRQPRYIAGSIIGMGLAMLEMLIIVIEMNRSH